MKRTAWETIGTTVWMDDIGDLFLKKILSVLPSIVYWSWNSDIPIYDILGRIASVRWGRIGSLIQ